MQDDRARRGASLHKCLCFFASESVLETQVAVLQWKLNIQLESDRGKSKESTGSSVCQHGQRRNQCTECTGEEQREYRKQQDAVARAPVPGQSRGNYFVYLLLHIPMLLLCLVSQSSLHHQDSTVL